MTLIDLPDIEYISDDVTTTLNNVLQVHQAITGRTLAPADPERLLLQTMCVLIVQQRALINLTARSNMLRYATGPLLDHIGAFSNTPRLPAANARTTLRFTLSAPQLSVIIIPAGMRVSTATDPKRYFATAQYAEFPVGSTTIDVPAAALDAGIVGNDWMPNQINQIVDPIAFVASAANITESTGGADVEGDDAYRERIHKAPESFSVAGPKGAYEYWAKSASSSIVDVSVSSPAPGEVLIIPLLTGGEIPGQEILDAVEAACSDKTRRPLTDLLTVAAPIAVNYSVTFSYWISRARAVEAASIQAAVTSAVQSYVLWQKSKLGRDINPSELIRLVMLAGAHRVAVTAPVHTVVAVSDVAVAGTPSITYGGLEDG